MPSAPNTLVALLHACVLLLGLSVVTVLVATALVLVAIAGLLDCFETLAHAFGGT